MLFLEKRLLVPRRNQVRAPSRGDRTAGRLQAYVDIMRELSSMQFLRIHPNIVTFIGVCVEDPTKPILVEEYIKGKTLRKIMDVGRIYPSNAPWR